MKNAPLKIQVKHKQDSYTVGGSWSALTANALTENIVAELWRECRTLQSAGVSYHNYVTELTFLLFLKMMQETRREKQLGRKYRWRELCERQGADQLRFYQSLLKDLGDPKRTKDSFVLSIFKGAQTHIRLAKDLKSLTRAIDKLDWFSARKDGLGDLYEGLLEKTTAATKSKAGQYFTPRPLIDSIIRTIRPAPNEIIQDPAAGTGGFLVTADRYIKDNAARGLTENQLRFQQHSAIMGNEWVPDTHRLCLMNLLLHDIQSPVACKDTLSAEGQINPLADLVLTNPPFNKMHGSVNRADFTVTSGERVGPMPFLEHVVRALKPGGRAAVVLPDSILFGNGTGTLLRTWLMEWCNLHTILRLPTGIFYAHGVNTNVLFFNRGRTNSGNTKDVWVYDMRTGMPAFGKTVPLSAKHFADFETCFGLDPYGKSPRKDQGESGRFRRFTRDEIKLRNDNLDLTWLRAPNGAPTKAKSDIHKITTALATHLRNALQQIEQLADDLQARSDRNK